MGYDDQTIRHRNFIVRWNHRRRYQGTINLLQKYKPYSFLDYGAGTGSFILQLLNHRWKPEVIAAYEPMTTSYQDMENKLRNLNLLDRIKIYNNFSEINSGFDVVASMGVLEHLPFKQRHELYDIVKKVINPGGYFIVQVPVMIGFGMIFRMLGKLFLKRDEIPLSFKELVFAGLFFTVIDDDRRFDETNPRTFLSHRGFDHRKLLTELKTHFQLKEKFYGPYHAPWFLSHSFYSVFRVGN
jgi:SAM-dependent methyltransferase